MKIVIYGLGKSGTSALFYKVRNSLPPGTICLFEPSSYGAFERGRERLRALLRGRFAPDVLAKVLPFDPRPVRAADFGDFNRPVLIVRDPRDRLISGLLYRSYHAGFEQRPGDAQAFLRLLRLKEAEPASVATLDLIRLLEGAEAAAALRQWTDRYAEQAVRRPLRFHAERPHLGVFRYEQMVDGRFEELEAILGIPLQGSADVPPALRRVVRTKGYGTWRSWFTPADVDALRPILQPYLDRYYPAADWELDRAPSLDPAHGSDYVLRLLDERRTLAGLPPLPKPQ